jgi:hypothetical protein
MVGLFALAPGADAALGGGDPRSADRGDAAHRADAWIKLCGLSTGCVIDPPPHPWLGRDVYNATGRRQTVAVDINEGEGVRFWITVENDGTQADTLIVQGCPGTRYFEVNRVVLGRYRRPDAGATDVTRRYLQGTLSFDLDPGDRAVFTLNIITNTIKGETYRCLTEVSSAGDAGAGDTVVAEMTTY